MLSRVYQTALYAQRWQMKKEFATDRVRETYVDCTTCKVMLAYPVGASCVECPQCCQLLDPRAPAKITCCYCGHSLSVPRFAKLVQCCNCHDLISLGPESSLRRSDSHNAQKKPKSAKKLRPSFRCFQSFVETKVDALEQLSLAEKAELLYKEWREKTVEEKLLYQKTPDSVEPN